MFSSNNERKLAIYDAVITEMQSSPEWMSMIEHLMEYAEERGIKPAESEVDKMGEIALSAYFRIMGIDAIQDAAYEVIEELVEEEFSDDE